MTGFYVSIMFMGILLMVISLVWIAFDKKKYLDSENVLEEKKEMLVSVISDAEQMIEELNNLSDYVVSNISEKRQEVIDTIEKADKKIKEIKEEKISTKVDGTYFSEANKSPIDNKNTVFRNILSEEKDVAKSFAKSKVEKKVVSINNRHKEVIDLSQSGLNETQIAKKLNMGKGEIQLILGINK
ncbi:hypothetical protein RBH29_05360 [Herbivorax sp. ANBcel31]|uniref:DUF6115 domain-containing protein n=1 Tax=Herbivorax sp. ANBcel31 TaxID=3069754 RepID=UPI0027B7A8A2|nr:hypothetical protein [Herbivorax sp. ANBcel31]MDQ2085864.1 hypothetical protein [Herbivorax sp. ANBcel31]